MDKGQKIRLQINDMTTDGSGIGRSEDGLTVFVKGALPGDTVQAEIFRVKKRYALARLLSIDEPSEDRTEGFCSLDSRCGGCPMGRLTYDAQLRLKERHVRDALTRIAGLRDPLIRPALEAALDAEHFGFSDEGNGKTIVIDFSSPNIAKPFHIGHIRTTVIGYSIYKIYDSLGYNVVRTNHLGDYGTQFGKMICAYRHWGNDEDVQRDPIRTLLSYYTKFHVEAEKDPELNEEARKTFYDLEHGGEDEIRLWKWFSDLSLREFNRVYDMMGIEFDAYDGESMYSDMMPRHIEDLKQKGLLKESQGAMVVNLDQFDLPPALIQKSDGTSLYCTRDIATAVYRKEHYDFYKNIYVVASQQTLYFRQLFKVLELMGYEWAKDCVHVPFGMVALEEGTLSTRKGRVVFLEDVLNKAVEKTKEIILEKNPDAPKDRIDEVAKEVGIGAVMFNELSNSRIKDYVFKWDQVLNFDGETGPYVQYTHARCCSVLRKAGEETLRRGGVSLRIFAASRTRLSAADRYSADGPSLHACRQ